MFSQELIFNPQMMLVRIVLAIYIAAPILIITLFRRKKWMQRCGTVIAAYVVGLIMALFQMTTFPKDSIEELVFHQWQTNILYLSIPLAIPLLLFKCDFRLWGKALPGTISALLSGIASVMIAILLSVFLLKDFQIPSFEKLAVLMTGMYTGGLVNFNALGASFGVNQSLMAVALTFEMLFLLIYMMFLLSGGYKVARRLLPFTDETTPVIQRHAKRMTEAPVHEVEDYNNMFSRENFLGMMAALGLSILFLAVAVGVSYLMWYIGVVPPNPETPEMPVMNELIIILVITTLSIAASFSERVRNLPKTFELGMFFILVFSVVLSSLFSWKGILESFMGVGLFVVSALVLTLCIHLLLCRWLHISGDLFTVSSVALLCSPPFVPPVVAAMGNKKVLISGIVIGLIGYAVGTYLGVALAWLLNVL